MPTDAAVIEPIQTFKAGELSVRIHAGQDTLARAAAFAAKAHLTETLLARQSAAIILATGNSQIRFLDALIQLGGIDWSRITAFHMDEYLGISSAHKASFRHYMKTRVESRVPLKAFHYLEGDAPEPIAECERYEDLLRAQPIDLCCMGVGENGHLAFNDPPVANFADTSLVKIVKLDDACKLQQVKEGHFPSLDAVNPYALTLTIPALCTARRILCLAPEERKAAPVKQLIEGPIAESCPASYLRTQPQATLYLDTDSARLLNSPPKH